MKSTTFELIYCIPATIFTYVLATPYTRSEMNEEERPPHASHHLHEGEDISDDDESGEDSRGDKWSWKKDGERRGRTSPGMDRNQREGTRRSGSESGGGGGAGGKDSEGGGVQVTIRADGERAVNSDGHVRRVAGRLFVELHCPHCPSQKSITFKVRRSRWWYMLL